MEKPIVRIVDKQQEEIREVDATSSEANYLLSKYGYSNPVLPEKPNMPKGLTFEEMVIQQEIIDKVERDRKQLELYNRMNAPKPITFGGNVEYSETKFIDVEEGFGVKITIVSNMK